MTLREAAERTSRSITTLRRYIRSGRLHAEKRYGRFGPEYFVSEQDLSDAGLEPEAREPAQALTRQVTGKQELPVVDERLSNQLLREIVPLSLFQDLQMKHEQLLVQYGMVRAGGLRVMELRADLDDKDRQLEQAESSVLRLRREHALHISRLKRSLREAHLELEGRRLEIDALQEKVKALEMLARNAVTSESIDDQIRRVGEQTRRVDDLQGEPNWPQRSEDPPPDH